MPFFTQMPRTYSYWAARVITSLGQGLKFSPVVRTLGASSILLGNNKGYLKIIVTCR